MLKMLWDVLLVYTNKHYKGESQKLEMILKITFARWCDERDRRSGRKEVRSVQMEYNPEPGDGERHMLGPIYGGPWPDPNEGESDA